MNSKKGAPVQPQPGSKKRGIVTRFKHLIRYIRRGCRLMKLARSSFYYRPRSKSPEQMKTEADLRERVEAISLDFPRYGYRRVTYQLRREGKQVNHKKVLKIMRESDLLCRVKRSWVRTTDSPHRFPRYLNLTKAMVINRLNQV